MYARLSTFLATLLISTAAIAAGHPGDRFAECTGRLSAELEHQWLLGDPAADRTETMRDHMRDLLASVTTGETSRDNMAILLNAKVAHKALLANASFSQDRASGNRSAMRADILLSGCLSLLLG